MRQAYAKGAKQTNKQNQSAADSLLVLNNINHVGLLRLNSNKKIESLLNRSALALPLSLWRYWERRGKDLSREGDEEVMPFCLLEKHPVQACLLLRDKEY